MSNSFLCVTSWTVTCQALLFTGFSRQEYWSGFPFLPPGDLLNPGVEPASPTLEADSSPLSYQESPYVCVYVFNFVSRGRIIFHFTDGEIETKKNKVSFLHHPSGK